MNTRAQKLVTLSDVDLREVAGGAVPLPAGSMQLSASPNVWFVPKPCCGGPMMDQSFKVGTSLHNGGWDMTRPWVPHRGLEEHYWLATPRY